MFADDERESLEDDGAGGFDAVIHWDPRNPQASLMTRIMSGDNHEVPLYGGRDAFFKPGSQILDIGSGGGQAVKEIDDRYGGKV